MLALDFETYGSVDLPKHGLDRYVSDPHFRPLIACAIWRSANGQRESVSLDFVDDMPHAKAALAALLEDHSLVAHNVGFELAVLKWLGIEVPLSNVYDSAVVARAMGAASSLAAAAPQLLQGRKLEVGQNLIKLFSIPGKYQEESGSPAFDRKIIADYPNEWAKFYQYCHVDAQLSLDIVEEYVHWMPASEWENHAITMRMNQAGWPVDVPSVQEMQRRYTENLAYLLEEFRSTCNAPDLNLNSMAQMKEWCLARGIKANSFDEAHVASMAKRLRAKLGTMNIADDKYSNYWEVEQLMLTKQALGGSSLKKLAVILNTTGNDGRLRDQYMHIGAGQSWRTTGRGVQMQNLKRFTDEPADMSLLFDDRFHWDNDHLAENIRQVFTSSNKDGALIVGDFSSVESRGLAWQAGEEWKLQAYRNKRDVYKDLATRIYPGLSYEAVTKPERQTGKVGELSCGYQAGGSAVQSFAAGMGVDLSEGEAAKLVSDWREACPDTVDYWWKLDEMLHLLMETGGDQMHQLPDGFTLLITEVQTPASLLDQVGSRHGKLRTIRVKVLDKNLKVYLMRLFIGCHMKGRNIGYFKPLDRRSGDLWDNMYTNAKTKKREPHTIYGGKLAGILTQSFCREMFFQVLRYVQTWVDVAPNVQLIGQFHDEIVMDWWPSTERNALSLSHAKKLLEGSMSDPGLAKSFPMAAEVKHDYRYTK